MGCAVAAGWFGLPRSSDCRVSGEGLAVSAVWASESGRMEGGWVMDVGLLASLW